MKRIVNTHRLQDELIARGLVPADCRLLEVSIPANPSAMVIRYEVFVRSDQLGQFADALRAAAEAAEADA